MIDPFSDEADPVRLDEHLRPDGSDRIRFGRRPVVLALALLPAAVSLSGCVRTTPACPTQPGNSHHCRHRFCRYYRG